MNIQVSKVLINVYECSYKNIDEGVEYKNTLLL